MTPKTEAERIRWLLHEVWNDNQSQMSRDTNCAQSTLSMVLSGKNEPGKRLLTLIAKHPKVSSDWLFHGKGPPLTGAAVDPIQGFSLPIADRPLRRPPEELPEALTDQRQEVVRQLARPGSYFVRVQPDEPIVHDLEMQICQGDLVLVSTAPDTIPRMESLYEKLCIIRHPTVRDQVCFARVTYQASDLEGDSEKLEADTFDLGIRDSEIVRRSKTVKLRGHKRVVTQLFIRQQAGEQTRLVPVRHLELEPPLHQINYRDVVGVCLTLVRRL